MCFGASANNRIDSIQQRLSLGLTGEERFELWLGLASEYAETKKDMATACVLQALALTEATESRSYQAKAYHVLGQIQNEHAQYDSAIYYFRLAISLFNQETEKQELAETLNERGIVYENKGYYTEAFEDYLNSLKLYESIGDTKGIVNEYQNLGLIHFYKGEFTRAEEYFKDALNLSRNIMYRGGIASALNNLAISLKERGEVRTALDYFQQVLKMDQEDGDRANIAYSLNNVGTTYALLGNHKQALKYYFQSAILKYTVPDYIGLSNTFNNISSSLIHEGAYQQARHYLDSSLLLSTNYKFRNNIAEIYKTYYELELALKHYPEALEYYRRYSIEKDSIEQAENTLAISKLQAVHDLDKTQKELKIKEKALSVEQSVRYIAVVAVLLLVMVCVYFYYNVRRINKLNQLLNMQRKDLIEAKEHAEDASMVKSQFLSVVSHEIRTPLNAIIGVANLLSEDEALPKEHAANVSVLKTSSQQLLQLINDLLDLNKLELGKMQADREQMSIAKVAESIMKMFSVSAAQKGLSLEYNIDHRISHYLMGDDVKLTQVLTNLVGNAVKFTDSGYVKLNITQVKTHTSSEVVRFSVEDSGIGIAEADQYAIFDSFTQSNPDAKKYGGSGLGLAISKKLIEVMGGEIVLVSKPGLGAVFSFELEFFVQPHTISQPTRALQTKPFNGKRILIAEDNPVNVFVLKQFLHKWEAQTEVAVNGEEALKLLEQRHFDLVLMDVHMPVKDGIETTKAIRSSTHEWCNIPIIAITASYEENVREEVILCGMNDYVMKPFVPEALQEKLLKQL